MNRFSTLRLLSHPLCLFFHESLGAPTIAMNCRVHPLEGTWIVPEEKVEGFVSWPNLGKHMSFDGRWLHAAPCNLMEEGMFQKQVQFTPKEKDEKWNKLQKRRHRRVTFLVNIWLNYRPFDLKPFPDTMVDKMSGQDESTRKKLRFLPAPETAKTPSSGPGSVRKTTVTSTVATEDTGSSYVTKEFTWPLGDKNSGEKLQLEIPLKSVRDEASNGGNVKIEWQTNSSGDSRDIPFRIYDKASSPQSNRGCCEDSSKRLPDDNEREGGKRIRLD
mmetsp:Transcript_6642/g.12078  ORF Transcript_6642/g.12078 Transcript_6642/m.12078 type:complete len:273 (+) Transcript_6642:303-1121(+)